MYINSKDNNLTHHFVLLIPHYIYTYNRAHAGNTKEVLAVKLYMPM